MGASRTKGNRPAVGGQVYGSFAPHPPPHPPPPPPPTPHPPPPPPTPHPPLTPPPLAKYFLVRFTYSTIRKWARDDACRFLSHCDKYFSKKWQLSKIRLFAKIRLLGRNSKIRLGEDTLRCLKVLHAKFHDAPTNSKKVYFWKNLGF